MTTKDLQKAYEDAEAKAQKLMAEKDDAVAKIRDRYRDRLQEANQQAADAQKAWLDHQVLEALKNRPDGEATARARVADGSLREEDVNAVFGNPAHN